VIFISVVHQHSSIRRSIRSNIFSLQELWLRVNQKLALLNEYLQGRQFKAILFVHWEKTSSAVELCKQAIP
jgi:hypothetical protein